MAIENLITNHLALWTAAVRPKSSAGRGSNSKLELTGIKKLRELILELAVRGKLVPQDPSDEPASVLLERIAVEKTRLVKEGKIKKPKALAEIGEEEKQFGLPKGWEWCRINDVLHLENGDRSKNYPNKSALVENGIPFVNAGQLSDGLVSKDELCFISKERFDILNGGKFNDGDILFCLRGSLGKCAVVKNFGVGAIASSLVILRPYLPPITNYIMIVMNAPITSRNISKYNNGTAQPNLSAADLSKFGLPLPPLVEQHRIVAKVDELMALCDQLELCSESQLAAHQTLVETLLATLTDSSDADELAQNWARLSTHFDTLFTTEASIDTLKQTILQLAVMGKLVPQDPSDEPASALLDRIAAEKAQLVKEKKIKKEKPLPAISEDEKPFELPQGWAYSYIASLCNCLDYLRIPINKEERLLRCGDVPYYGANGQVGFIDDYLFDEDLVLVVEDETFIGRTKPFSYIVRGKSWVNNHAHVLRPLGGMSADYLNLCLQYYDFIPLTSGTTGRKKLTQAGLMGAKLWLAPLAEQQRIVVKVDELMTLCDQLKSLLLTSQQTQLALADSLVGGALV
ncbi:restriction endonuclease subunit S [Aeromonas hydrophila]|uniref:restriction endonuclease subunit S n=1 Tax=Aeromonas hydrophila TaxID=644 RepID=UPI00227C68FB|nr:restriction endonuclease subunit S [Aeromonas hydrophila]WAF89355.1 restriction endonuclease subunit S [Aeromonas hydrophila]WAG02071.1 restriction endonuclease subunit S [Aeromonas hydrophila]